MTLYDAQGNYLVAPELPLATKQGRHIPNEQREEAPLASMDARKEQVLLSHPDIRVRSLRSDYNCMGMVFANRRTWIDPEHLQIILVDDGYRQANDETELQPGDVVVYRDDSGEVSHVGLVTEVRIDVAQASREIFVLSQWGRYGEYFHRIDDVNPWLGTPVEYWTDRTEVV